MNWVAYLDTIRQDMRYALRTMRNNPAFAVTAVLTLALSIGADTAIFAVVYSVLLKPLPYHDPDRLVRIPGGATPARFEEIRTARPFTEVGAFTVEGSGICWRNCLREAVS